MAGGFPLGTRVELDLDGWVDVTDRVYARDPISISRGRAADASSTDPASCRFTLDNRDDAFSMRNPLGPYFGRLRRNVPVRVSLPAAVPGMLLRYNNPLLNTLSNATADDTVGRFAFSTDLDVRVEIDADQWERGHLIGKYLAQDGNRDFGFYAEGGKLTLVWSPDGLFASRIFVTSNVLFPDRGPAHRAVRAVLTLATGTVTFYTANTLAGPWTVAQTITGAGATTVNHGIAGIQVGNINGIVGQALPGRVVAAEVRSAGALLASPNFAGQPVGTATFTDAQTNVWRVRDDAEITDRDVRFYGEVSQWPQSRDVAGVDKTVTVTAYGIRRRLSLNAPALDSAMVREFASPKRSAIVAYWPMEDAAGATQIASAFPDYPAMNVYGAPELATYPDWPSSKPLPKMQKGAFVGSIPAYDASTNVIQVRLFLDMDTAPAARTNLLMLRTTTMLWFLDTDQTGNTFVVAKSTDQDTTYYSDSGPVSFLPELQKHGFVSLNLTIQQSGSNVAWDLDLLDFQSDQVWNQPIPNLINYSGTITGRSVGRATQITIARDYALGDVAVGHLAIANTVPAFAGTAGALNTWNGETAEERFARLTVEDGLTVRVNDGGGAEGYRNGFHLGKQVADTWLALLEDAELSDLGLLAEPRDELGFVYRSRWGMTNQAAKVSLDYDAGEIAGDLSPVDDDNALVNDVTVSRNDGGSARAQDTGSALSVLPPPFGVGPYAEQVDISAQADDWLPDQAAYRLRFGTVDEARYPTLSVNLHSPRVSDEQARRVRSLDIGDRIDILNADAWAPSVPQIVTGYVEELQVTTHVFTYNLTPGDPWTAAVVDSGDRYDTAGSALAVAVGDGLASDPLGVPLVTWAGSGLADGALITAGTAGTGDTGFNTVQGTFTASSGRAQGDQVSGVMNFLAWTEAVLGTTRTRFGVRATFTLSALPSGNVRPLQAYTATNTLLWYTSITPAGILRIHKADSTLLAVSAAALPLNTPVRMDALSLGGVVTLRVYVGGALWDTLTGDAAITAPLYQVRFGPPQTTPVTPRFWLDDMSVTDPDASPAGGLSVATLLGPLWTTAAAEFPFDVMCGGERMRVTAIAGTASPQTFTVTRGVNGIQAAHGVGTDVRLADPAYATL